MGTPCVSVEQDSISLSFDESWPIGFHVHVVCFNCKNAKRLKRTIWELKIDLHLPLMLAFVSLHRRQRHSRCTNCGHVGTFDCNCVLQNTMDFMQSCLNFVDDAISVYWAELSMPHTSYLHSILARVLTYDLLQMRKMYLFYDMMCKRKHLRESSKCADTPSMESLFQFYAHIFFVRHNR